MSEPAPCKYCHPPFESYYMEFNEGKWYLEDGGQEAKEYISHCPHCGRKLKGLRIISSCKNCRFGQKTKLYGRHYNYQCGLDCGVHRKTFTCKRHQPMEA